MAESHEVPALNCWISIALFTNVSNAAQLRGEATSGRIEAVLLDPTLIVSPFHILAAANKAIVNKESGQMTTKNIYSEVIFSLSPSTNISDSFKKFGIKDSSQNLLIVWITPSSDYQSQIERFKTQVKGQLTSLSDLAELNDHEEITKVYRISVDESAISSLENSIVTRLVVKDIT